MQWPVSRGTSWSVARGRNPDLGVVDLAALLASFRKAHPGVTLRLNWGAAGDLARAVIDGELDIAFIDGPVDRARRIGHDLGHDALVLAMCRDDRLAQSSDHSPQRRPLRDRDFVEYRRSRPGCGLRSTQRAPAPDRQELAAKSPTCSIWIEMVRWGAGLSILPPMAIRPVSDDVIGIPVTPAIRLFVCRGHRWVVRRSASLRALLDLLTCQSRTKEPARRK